MVDPLKSARAVLTNAKGHSENFRIESKRYLNNDPFARVAELDSRTGETVHKLKLARPIPSQLETLASDAVYNLRSTLDQIGYAVSIAAGGRGKSTYFPFGDTPSEVKSRGTTSSKEIPHQIFTLMESFQPHLGGNDLLWSLNKIGNTDKHRFLVPTVIATEVQSLDVISTAGPFRMPANLVWDSEKNEMELARTMANTKFQFDVNFSIFISFGEVQVVMGAPAFEVLDALARVVESILMAVEAEARRLRLFT